MNRVNIKTTGLILFLFTLSIVNTNAQNSPSQEIVVVNKIFQAFGNGNMEALKKTLSDSTVWKYYGSDLIPFSGIYTGKNEVEKFIGNIVANVDILDFKVDQIIANGKMVVVLGSEKQKVKRNGNIIEQKWVLVYTVENGLISKMEEYANTAYSEKLFN